MEVRLEPYLFFRGQCREAMEFYKFIFGGDLVVQTYGEIPGNDAQMKDQVMHASLNGDIVLMASDGGPENLGTGKISLSLVGTDEIKLRQWFEGLKEGGVVGSELKKEFWGDTFGMVTDKYGIDWMVNISAEKG